MGVDSFICGECHNTFHDINLFLQHKTEKVCAASGSLGIKTGVAEPEPEAELKPEPVSEPDPEPETKAIQDQEFQQQPPSRNATVLIEVQGEGGKVELHELELAGVGEGDFQLEHLEQGVHQVLAQRSLTGQEVIFQDGGSGKNYSSSEIHIVPQDLPDGVQVVEAGGETMTTGDMQVVQEVLHIDEDGQVSMAIQPSGVEHMEVPESGMRVVFEEEPGPAGVEVSGTQQQVRRLSLVPMKTSAEGQRMHMVVDQSMPRSLSTTMTTIAQPAAEADKTGARTLTLVPVVKTQAKGGESPLNLQLVMTDSPGVDATPAPAPAPSQPQKSGRRRGRPRKGEEKPAKVLSKPKEAVRPQLPDLAADGKYHCFRCKKSFRKDRHYNTHKCLASSDYVDITKKDLLLESGADAGGTEGGEEEEEEEEEEEGNPLRDSDPTPDFKYRIPNSGHRPRGRPRRSGVKTTPKETTKKGRGAGSWRIVVPPVGPSTQHTTMLKPDQDESTSGTVQQLIEGIQIQPVITDSTATDPVPDPTDIDAVVAPPGDEQKEESKPTELELADAEAQQLISTASAVECRGIVTNPDVSLSDALGVLPMDPVSLPIAVVEHGLLEGRPQPELMEESSPVPPPRRGRKPKKIIVSDEPARTMDQIPDLSVFVDEADKIAFEQCLNVDLSQADGMFKTHLIKQSVNENAPPSSSRTSDQLSVYSCGECEKVFMSLSHMRLHCLIHTNVKPFRCAKCDYATNTKGNLYTHMRWHTGQLYRCLVCDFVTVNKAHLAEHEATHSGVRHKCQICKRDYNTTKSLLNHIKRSHSQTKGGKELLKEMLPKHGHGPAMLHQCHICNRKFKKKTDRDRHLMVHNVKPNPEIHVCELCNHTASRKTYLLQHYLKHRVVYVCSECGAKYPSTIRLHQHFCENHVDVDVDREELRSALEELLKKSLSSSLFLPEASGVFKNWNHDEEDLALIQESEGDPPEAAKDEAETDLQQKDPDGGVEADENAPISANESPPIPANENAPISNLPDESLFQEEGVDVPEAEAEDIAAAEGILPPDSEESDSEGDLIVARAQGAETDIGLYEKMGFKQMDLEIFQKLQKTFGSEECEYCGRLFYARADHAAHLRTHTGVRPYSCDQCSYRSVTKDNLKRHIEREHDKVAYECSECGYTASTRTRLWHHQQSHKEVTTYECKPCEVQYDSFKRLKTHLQVKHRDLTLNNALKLTNMTQKLRSKIGKKSYKCPYCDRTFLRSNSDLQKHLWIHEGVKPFKCPLCPHATRSKNNLTSHMLRHSNEKPFLCTHCGKAYKSRTALRWHVRSHKDGKMFKCNRCPYEATQKSHLKRHMETHNIVKKFVCELCDFSSNTLGYMKIHYTRTHKGHQYTHNPGLLKVMAPDTKVYRCLSCDYLFGNLTEMKRHLCNRHHVQKEDLQELENLDMQQATHIPVQIVARDEVVEVDHTADATNEEDTGAALQALQYSAPSSEMDEKTASAVTLLQQIIDMSQQGAFDQQQQLTMKLEDGQNLVTVDPETIIVQPPGAGEEVVVDDAQHSQYVIQYRYITEDGQEVIGDKVMSDVQVQEVTVGDLMADGAQLQVMGQEVEGSEVIELAESGNASLEESSRVVTEFQNHEQMAVELDSMGTVTEGVSTDMEVS